MGRFSMAVILLMFNVFAYNLRQMKHQAFFKRYYNWIFFYSSFFSGPGRRAAEFPKTHWTRATPASHRPWWKRTMSKKISNNTILYRKVQTSSVSNFMWICCPLTKIQHWEIAHQFSPAHGLKKMDFLTNLNVIRDFWCHFWNQRKKVHKISIRSIVKNIFF